MTIGENYQSFVGRWRGSPEQAAEPIEQFFVNTLDGKITRALNCPIGSLKLEGKAINVLRNGVRLHADRSLRNELALFLGGVIKEEIHRYEPFLVGSLRKLADKVHNHWSHGTFQSRLERVKTLIVRIDFGVFAHEITRADLPIAPLCENPPVAPTQQALTIRVQSNPLLPCRERGGEMVNPLAELIERYREGHFAKSVPPQGGLSFLSINLGALLKNQTTEQPLGENLDEEKQLLKKGGNKDDYCSYQLLQTIVGLTLVWRIIKVARGVFCRWSDND